MKFKRTWIREMAMLPSLLQNVCINYKRWKKIKNLGFDVITRHLLLDMKVVDDSIANKERFCIFSLGYCKRPSAGDEITKMDRYKFACLNKTCVYKVCKRLDKRYKLGLMEWLGHVRKDFLFMGGFYIKRMECELFGCNEECPICMDENKTMMIAECGHAMCIECLEEMYKIKGKKGILKHIIAAYDVEYKSHCPICRTYSPYSRIDDKHIWPDTTENRKMLNKTIH